MRKVLWKCRKLISVQETLKCIPYEFCIFIEKCLWLLLFHCSSLIAKSFALSNYSRCILLFQLFVFQRTAANYISNSLAMLFTYVCMYVGMCIQYTLIILSQHIARECISFVHLTVVCNT